MHSKIEKMNKMRRNILKGMLIGWGILFLWILLPTARLFIRDYKLHSQIFWITGIIILSIYIIVYLIYKWKIMKDPSVQTAVNDERVRLDWLRAFRFAFFTLIGITIFWKWWETSLVPEVLHRQIRIIHPPWLIWFVSIFALIGSFLYYNREIKED